MDMMDDTRILANRFNLATRAARIAVWDWDYQTGTLHWSPVFLEILGIEPSEFSGDLADFIDRLVPEDRDRVSAALDAHIQNGEPYDIHYQMFGADGRRISIHATGKASFDASGTPINMVGTVQDITDKRTLEARLLSAERIAQIGHWFLDLTSFDLTWSPETFRIHGLDPDVDPQPDVDAAFGFYHPDDVNTVRAAFDELMATGKLQAVEARLRLRNGETRHVLVDGVATIGGDGKPKELLGIVHNRTEAVKKEEQLRRAQRLEAVGQLVGGIAHDFNNLLAVIQGNLEFLLDDLSSSELAEDDRRGILNSAMSASRRGADLTGSLLAFARKSQLEPQLVDINDVVRETEGWLSRAIPATIDMKTHLTDAVFKTSLDPTSLQSALVNIIVNARDSMPDGGKLTIESALVTISDSEMSSGNEFVPAGRYVMLAVTDTGTGIPPHLLPNVFEPFVTTKRVGEGSGLGLSMVQGFAKQSDGFVRIYSEPDEGTCVKLYFPVIEGEPVEDPSLGSEGAEETLSAPSARILIAEDQLDVLSVIVRSLTSAGYDIEAATNGDQAFEKFKASDGYDLLLTDVVMPGKLSGPNLAKACREIDPDLPVIFMSGYASEATVHGNGLRSEDIRLTKPVPRRDLLDAIKSCLRARK